ncbi:helix-turn-helix domain-containing protein [Mycolicibacter algericus]|uniref:HTH cro/C1-type domain-containing protein n=1 Tax=Mycolicibacter algericus DSM 45454 TaxID=723879 RepID=A0ABX3RZ25_MYCAL|nr:helix-turn-helix transcriptional regulator [Mycolicibacter algericus]OQZ99076.1 hypothetical protein BST10_02480 [Mycolicibacter algericus DSM 45454]
MDGNSSDWPRSLSARIGAAIRAAREQQHVSALRLSELTRALGAPVHRNALAKLEAGERDITLPELVAIAAALGTVPTALAVPVIAPGVEVLPGVDAPAATPPVEVLPGRSMPAVAALGWFTGRGPDNPAGVTRHPTAVWELERALELIDADRRLAAHRALFANESDPAVVEQHRGLIDTLQNRRDELAAALGGA